MTEEYKIPRKLLIINPDVPKEFWDEFPNLKKDIEEAISSSNVSQYVFDLINVDKNKESCIYLNLVYLEDNPDKGEEGLRAMGCSQEEIKEIKAEYNKIIKILSSNK